MFKYFDASFLAGSVLAVAALAIAYVALNNASLPVVGTSTRGALLALIVVGMAACAAGGISQAQPLGWTHPFIILGSIVGVLALVVSVAGLAGWEAPLRPIAQLSPASLALDGSAERLAIIGLAALIAAKAIANVAFAAVRTVSGS